MTRICKSFDFFGEAAEATPSEPPQSSQNLVVAEFSAPHFVHRFDSGLPHSAQNFLPDVLSVLHFEQRTRSALPPVKRRRMVEMLFDALV